LINGQSKEEFLGSLFDQPINTLPVSIGLSTTITIHYLSTKLLSRPG
jgi:hypothetical protein